LLYLTKHSRPDISNAIHELAKVMDGATEGHTKMLYLAIKYVVDTKNKCLYLEPSLLSEVWEIKGISDSNYAGDRDTRICVTGYLIYVNGALISRKSCGQIGVTLSSTEAEYVALSELCMELMFIKMNIESIGIKVKLPMSVYMDNVGAVFLAQNATTGQRTKHIDIRYYYARELVEKEIIEVVFLNTMDKDADIFTKNVSGDIYKRHSGKVMKLYEKVKYKIELEKTDS
jgi:hypothetical protein